MQLRHLTTENQKQLRTKNIICIEHSDSYLKELQARFPDIYNSITCIVDDYKRNQGEVNIQDRQVSVEDTSYLNDIDYNQSSILRLSISSGIYQKLWQIIRVSISLPTRRRNMSLHTESSIKVTHLGI